MQPQGSSKAWADSVNYLGANVANKVSCDLLMQHAFHLINTPYQWAGRLRAGEYGADCWGYWVAALRNACKERKVEFPSYLESWWTEMAFLKLPKLDLPRPGALVFYGKKKVSHVMGVVYPPAGNYFPNGMVLGASGGDERTITRQIAKDMRAYVKIQTPLRYREDVLGIRSLAEWVDY